ncbi:MAG: glycosyltransferase [Coriobacteriales bacterium]|jgi:hypothetical protein|nr:glycosyltransferase [Coriobacteriales bacterium]
MASDRKDCTNHRDRKDRKAVSVVVTTRGSAENLLNLMASMLPQLTPEDEVLLVVDPPTRDAPSNMVREVADEMARQLPSVRVLTDVESDGMTAYEQAIRTCKGPYVFLAESGDIWMPDKISSVLDAFAVSGSVLILHDIELINPTRQVLAPSLFNLQENRSGFKESLFRNSYLGSSLAFLEPFKGFFLPFPPQVSRYEQWIGLIAGRFGGIALITKPLIGRVVAPENEAVLPSVNPREHRDERRSLLKAFKRREKELATLLRRIQQTYDKESKG